MFSKMLRLCKCVTILIWMVLSITQISNCCVHHTKFQYVTLFEDIEEFFVKLLLLDVLTLLVGQRWWIRITCV